MAENSGVIVESEDINKWEMETKPWLDELYFRLIGYSENKNGLWIRDESLPQMMNKKGANAFINELKMRLPINMQFSDLNERKILFISTETSEAFINLVEGKYQDYGVEPNYAVLEDLGLQLYHVMDIMLNIARDGGMKRHRELRGVQRFIPPQAPPQGVY